MLTIALSLCAGNTLDLSMTVKSCEERAGINTNSNNRGYLTGFERRINPPPSK